MNAACAPRARTCIAASIALAVAACDGAVVVETGVPAVTADETVSLLHAHHIGAWKASTGTHTGQPTFQVEVRPRDLPSAVRVLRDGASPHPSPENTSQSSLPTPVQEHQSFVAAVSRDLERSLQLWDGVIQARVHITSSRRAPLHAATGDEPKAVVLLRVRRGDVPSEAEVHALVAGAIAGLTHEQVQVFRVHAQPPSIAPLVQVGPIAVTAGSAPVLRNVLLALLSLTAALTVALVWLWHRNRNAAG